MAKKIKLTEKTLTRMIKNILEQELDDETIIDIENEELPQEVDLTDISYSATILTRFKKTAFMVSCQPHKERGK